MSMARHRAFCPFVVSLGLLLSQVACKRTAPASLDEVDAAAEALKCRTFRLADFSRGCSVQVLT